VGYKVEGDGGPRAGRNRKGTEGGVRSMSRSFIALTGFAGADVLGDKTTETREGEVTGEGLDGTASAVMAGKGGIMVKMEEGEAEGIVWREVNSGVLEEEVIMGGISVEVGDIRGRSSINEVTEEG